MLEDSGAFYFAMAVDVAAVLFIVGMALFITTLLKELWLGLQEK